MKAAASFIQTFTHWAVASNLQFSEPSRYQARLSFIDTIACMLAGADAAQAGKAYQAMLSCAANGTVKSVCGKQPLSATAAALVNATAAHALDFDDYALPGSTHPSTPMVSALLVLAELQATRIGELTDAYLIGYEAIIRLGEALSYEHYMKGWHATSTIVPFGVAAACARLLRLDKNSFANALSLSLSMSAGLKKQIGSDAKAIHAGLAARAGIEATLLARSGISANQKILEGAYGFVNVYGGVNSPGVAYAATKIGKVHAIQEYPMLRKPWPSCAYTHRSIEAAINLTGKNNFDVRKIASCVVSTPTAYAMVAGFRNPVDTNQARFSLDYCIASTLTDRRFGVDSLTSKALQRPQVKTLAGKIEIDDYPLGEASEDLCPRSPDTVELIMACGDRLSETIAEVKGGANKPLTTKEIKQKFISCSGSTVLGDFILTANHDALFRLSAY